MDVGKDGQTGRRRLTSTAVKHGPRIGRQPVTDLLTALDQQTVTLPGSAAAETVLPKLADSLRTALLEVGDASAFPTSRAYYVRKRTEGKRHNATLICLAQRRCDVLHAMLRNHTTYQPRPAAAA